MTSLANIISINVWRHLPDSLKLGCVGTLIADFNPANNNPECLSHPEFCAGVVSQLVDVGHRWNGGGYEKVAVETVFKAVLTGEYATNPRLGNWLHQHLQKPEEAAVFAFLSNPQDQTTLDELRRIYTVLTDFDNTKKARELHARLAGAIMAFEVLGMVENVALPTDFWQAYWEIYKDNLSRVFSLLPSTLRIKTSASSLSRYGLRGSWVSEHESIMSWNFFGSPGNETLVQRIQALTDEQQVTLLISLCGQRSSTPDTSLEGPWPNECMEALQASLQAIEST